eukprot:CAMPEP_0194779010 /NCGR_PEP_ID=MMETSP0323_2-20130528/69876_1 /TAXON_ID=2866 ORGANISM="Crypthecodinium cohnii, Strain Seligo" /NCGR_SAMPLE_ID=MMETSP0323_2 /ASSEMBLY_ACC=CAM_ASM_000346 /LENGTH=66 /DNA_ID=CAMNT_0039716469 /DNA_START=456 /DNA_END=656 /DNA_ORIENTATION=-
MSVLAMGDRDQATILTDLPDHDATQLLCQRVARLLLDGGDSIEADGEAASFASFRFRRWHDICRRC